MQPSATAATTDLTVVAKGCGFKDVVTVESVDEAKDIRQRLHAGAGLLFVHARVDTRKHDRLIPTRDGYGMKYRFLQASSLRS
jgi:hypothetical protein